MAIPIGVRANPEGAMRIGFVQMKPVLGDLEGNLRRAASLVEGIEADIIVFPELFATGYLFRDRSHAQKLSEPAGGGLVYEALRSIAKKIGGLAAGGFPERDSQRLFNSVIAVEPGGDFHLYRKLHLFDREKEIFDPGDLRLQPFEFRGARVGLIICFDWIFPEVYRTLALKGAQIILHPSNLVLPYCQRASYARAVENGVFIVLANRVGEESLGELSLRFTGGSVIYSPRGEVLAQAGEFEERAVVVDIDPRAADDKWITQRNHILQDRRPEFYEL